MIKPRIRAALRKHALIAFAATFVLCYHCHCSNESGGGEVKRDDSLVAALLHYPLPLSVEAQEENTRGGRVNRHHDRKRRPLQVEPVVPQDAQNSNDPMTMMTRRRRRRRLRLIGSGRETLDAYHDPHSTVPRQPQPEPFVAYDDGGGGRGGGEWSEDAGSVTVQDVGRKLNHFMDTWDLYDARAIPMFWHIPKSGGSSIKNSLGGCHRLVMATEFGVTDGHGHDTQVAVVYPRIPGEASSSDRSPFVNVDSTTIDGIARAKSMGFADAGLADAVVSPFVYETNDLFTPTAKGRIFAVFRHPVDRAVSMFYYIQVADWEPTYRPDLKDWTLSQYAQSDIMENNWITRQLSNQPTGELTDEHLAVAMEVVRTKILVGLTNRIEASMERYEKFFRWKYHVDPSTQEECRNEMMKWGSNSNKINQREIPLPGDEAYVLLAHQNQFDIQLYNYIEALFREQEAFVTGHPTNYRNVGATCCQCDPPTYMEMEEDEKKRGVFECPKSVKNNERRRKWR